MDYVLADRTEVTDFLREPYVVSFLDHSSVSIRLLTPEGDYLYASSGVKKLLGYTAHELATMNAFGLLHPEDFDTAKEVAAAAASGRPIRFVTRAKTAKRDFVWVETRLNPYKGQVAAFVRASEAPTSGNASWEFIEPFL